MAGQRIPEVNEVLEEFFILFVFVDDFLKEICLKSIKNQNDYVLIFRKYEFSGFIDPVFSRTRQLRQSSSVKNERQTVKKKDCHRDLLRITVRFFEFQPCDCHYEDPQGPIEDAFC